jgi:GT2 family glycosyltransferase
VHGGYVGEHPLATVVIVGWRDAPYLRTCLRSVERNVPRELREVSVVLNEPTQALRSSLSAEFPWINPLSFRTNLGFGGAINAAVELVDTEYVVLLNDDCVVHPGWLEELLDTASRRAEAGAVGSAFLHPSGVLQEAGSVVWRDGTTNAIGEGGNLADWNFERRVDYCSGASLLVRTAAWRQVGGFDSRYYPAYYEDADLCLAIKNHGWQTWVQPLSRVDHIKNASSTHDYRAFMSSMNQARFIERWATELAALDVPGPLEGAAWRAMNRPARVLVFGTGCGSGAAGKAESDAERELVVGLSLNPAIHVAAYLDNGAGAYANTFARNGIRVITDINDHLAQPGVQYDDVVVVHPERAPGHRAWLAERMPGARLLSEAAARVASADCARNPSEPAGMARE